MTKDLLLGFGALPCPSFRSSPAPPSPRGRGLPSVTLVGAFGLVRVDDEDHTGFACLSFRYTARQQSDQGQSPWPPQAPEAQCRHAGEWVVPECSRPLIAHNTGLDALEVFADGPCADTVVQYTPVA